MTGGGDLVAGLLEELRALTRRVERLDGETLRLENENEQLRGENAQLRELLEQERRKGRRQAGPFSRGEPKKEPDRPGRRPGEKYGKHAKRAVPKEVAETKLVPCPLVCAQCGGPVELEGMADQYQTDIPAVEPVTTKFEIHYGRCLKCGQRVQGRDQDQISDATGDVGGVQIGPRAIALAAHMNKSFGMSYERIAELYGQVFDLTLERSTLARAVERLGQKAEPTYEYLIEVVRAARVVYPDETGWRIGGLKAWLWVATTLTATVYLIERGRGFPEAAKLLGELFAGIIGSDGWAVYRKFTRAQRQLCLAHLLRRCKELLETPPSEDCAEYVARIKAVLQKALSLRDRRDEGTISEHGFHVSKGKIEASMDRLLDDPDLHDESIRFALHLLNNRDALFVFLEHTGVEATNHLAERAIRPAVINRKTSGCNRTQRGARVQAVLMSVLRTCKQRCLNAIDVFSDILHDPVPRVHEIAR